MRSVHTWSYSAITNCPHRPAPAANTGSKHFQHSSIEPINTHWLAYSVSCRWVYLSIRFHGVALAHAKVFTGLELWFVERDVSCDLKYHLKNTNAWAGLVHPTTSPIPLNHLALSHSQIMHTCSAIHKPYNTPSPHVKVSQLLQNSHLSLTQFTGW